MPRGNPKGCIPWNKGLKGVQRHSSETRANLVIWEDELDDIDAVVDKIKVFAEAKHK